MIDYSDLIGVPFANKGRDVKTGLDCYGLVMEVYKRFGIDLPEYVSDFDNVEKVNSIIRQESENKSTWRRVEKGAEIPVPSVMAITFGVARNFVNHTGVYIGNGKFIHIRARIGVCVDRVDSPAWRKMIEGYYEFVGG